jgi:predicted alpha/beta superfamily hydrolase
LLQDGQNIFDAQRAVFGVEWGVDETAEQLIANQVMRPIILVAIYNSPRRIDEYTPFPDPVHGGGEAYLYRSFITDELLPFLASQYRVSQIREERAVIGSSLGGLVSLYLGWSQPETFGWVGALSPSLWWGHRGFITAIAGGEAPRDRPNIWLDAGSRESDLDANCNGVPDLIDDLRTLRAVPLHQGYREGEDLLYREVEGGTHDETSWSRRVGDVLTYFFPNKTRMVP